MQLDENYIDKEYKLRRAGYVPECEVKYDDLVAFDDIQQCHRVRYRRVIGKAP